MRISEQWFVWISQIVFNLQNFDVLRKKRKKRIKGKYLILNKMWMEYRAVL